MKLVKAPSKCYLLVEQQGGDCLVNQELDLGGDPSTELHELASGRRPASISDLGNQEHVRSSIPGLGLDLKSSPKI
jgi:hypothetical protein